MRYVTLLVLAMIFVGCTSKRQQASTDTTVQINFSADSRTWKQSRVHDTSKHSYTEFQLQGEDRSSWTELVSYSLIYSDKKLEEYVTDFEQKNRDSSDTVELQKTVTSDGTITVSYNSKEKNDIGILKFIKSPQGICIISYNVKPESKTESNYELWKKIIADSKIVLTSKS